jgi:hypothetical protein
MITPAIRIGDPDGLPEAERLALHKGREPTKTQTAVTSVVDADLEASANQAGDERPRRAKVSTESGWIADRYAVEASASITAVTRAACLAPWKRTKSPDKIQMEAKDMTKDPGRRWTARALGAAIALLPAMGASAQDLGWDFSTSVYGWFAGLDTSVGTEFGTVETDLSFSDVWSMLDVAFFGTFVARRGKLGFIVDLNYTDLSTTRTTPLGAAFSAATVDTTLTILSGYATWRVSDTDVAMVDLAGGFRAYDLELGVALAAGVEPAQSTSENESWVDPVIGARAIFPIDENWFATAVVDIGGFGIGSASDLSYQLLGTVGYRFNDRWSVQGGYRHIGIDKTLNGRDVTLDLSGPLLGVTARF